ncbi:MAG: ParB/RepB/Spo0J family partition protein [Chloroflexota bacterium]|nr:ParB/RepB/Spo0J family partition protein [Chloroflexota bacterium]
MELELSELELRYEALRTRCATRERRLLAALADVGQQTPIVVVRDGERWVVVDGYKRIRALTRLAQDTVIATAWELGEADALMLERLLRAGEIGSALEEGWLLKELSVRFGLGLEELGRRFDKTKSWVSRRLGLVCELPAMVQEHVRAGAIGAHAAMKYLVPLARANVEDCARLCDAIAPERPTSRQMGELYAAYVAAGASGRELVVTQPVMVLRARAEAASERQQGSRPIEQLMDDLRIVGAVARRARLRLSKGAVDDAEPAERDEVRRSCGDAHAEAEHLKRRCDKELDDAR